jgi:hypothetical protein
VQHEVSMKNGRLSKISKFACSVTCTWKNIGPPPKSSGIFSMTPSVESRNVLTDSMLRR